MGSVWIPLRLVGISGDNKGYFKISRSLGDGSFRLTISGILG